jgi:hypothetical protein
MARQQIQDLQGYDKTATPSATPVDTYTGKIGTPSQSTAQQLASALGTVANQGARLYAEQKQEERNQAKMRATAYAENFKSTVKDPSLSTPELQEQFPALKFSVLATIIEDKNSQAYQTATRQKLQSLPQEVRLDPDKLQQAFNGLMLQASKETEGQDFVNAGALRGVNAAYSSVQNEWAQQTQLFAEGEHKDNFQGNVFNLFKGHDLNTPEGMNTVIEGIQAQETKHRGTEELDGTSPMGKKGDKKLWKDNLLQYAKNNPEKGQEVLDVILDPRLKWLTDNNTEEFLTEAREEVTDLAIADMELNNKQLAVQLNERKVDLEVEIDNMIAEGKQGEVRKILSQPIPSDASDLDKASGLYEKELARVALARETADPEASNIRFNEHREDIKTAASTGDWSALGFDEAPNNDQLREMFAKDGVLTQQDATWLRNNLSDLRKGFATISDETLASDVGKKFALDLQYFNSEIPKMALGGAGFSAQQVMENTYSDSMKEQFNEFYTNPNYETGVPEGDVLKVMKATAYAEVEAVVTKLNTVLTQPETIQNLKSYKQELTQGEQQPETDDNSGDNNPPQPEKIEVGHILRDDAGNPQATFKGGDPNDDESWERYVTDEQIEEFKGRNQQSEKLFEGLPNNAIREAYGDDIRAYLEMVENREASEESIVDFFTNSLPNWWDESTTLQERINNLTRQQKIVYEKTGKFPEDFE